MTLRFILGRAGTGKTRFCLEEIVNKLKVSPEGEALILLVPEQATFQTERALLSASELKGIMRAEVLSFQRLAYRVLQEVGGMARIYIDELGKKMILRRFLERRKDKLRVFHWIARQPGFIDHLADVLKEFKNYRIPCEKLKAAADKLETDAERDILTDKLCDLTILYSDVQDFLADKHLDRDNYLDLLAEKINEWSYLEGAEVWVDGFTGFTPQELVVLERIMKRVNRFSITLCLDTEDLKLEIDDSYLFYTTRDTMRKLSDMAKRIGVEEEEPVLLDAGAPYRFIESAAISHLEREFFNRPVKTFKDDQDDIRVYAASNRRAEVEGVAREIIRLCRDEGYRFKEISVVMRELEPYSQLISSIFTDNNIPHFIDEKRHIMHHPLVELIRSALEVVIQNWSYEPVFRYLKTDLADVEREQVDLLENYVLAHGIRGAKWVDGKPWTFRRKYTLGEEEEVTSKIEKELEEINEAKQKAVKQLADFYMTIKKQTRVKDYTAALFKLLVDLKIKEKLEKWGDEARAFGKLDLALEHVQIWDNIIDLMEQVVEGLGDEELTVEQYAQIIDSGLKSIKIGLVPLGLDQVFVGNLDRSRNPDVKVSFILGVNDGVLPLRLKDCGMFTDTERQHLKEMGIELAPDSRRRLFDEQYHIYVAVTRASNKLYLSYPLADDEGKALMPSFVIRRIKRLFPGIEEKTWGIEPDGSDRDLEYITSPYNCLIYLPTQLRETMEGNRINPIWWDVYSWFISRDTAACQRVLQGLFYSNQETDIPRQLTRKLFGSPVKASVSQLERFQRCPFSHFLSHGLRLKERGIYRLTSPDLGQFFHAALDMFAKRIKQESLDWGELTKEQCINLAAEIVDDLAPKLQNEILMSTSRYRYMVRKLKKTVERAVLILREHSQKGSFRPVGIELTFGKGGILPPLVIELDGDGDYIELEGRIDRVDAAQLDDKVYLRVVDYKSGNDTFELQDIYYGLSLQLLIYLEVILTYAPFLVSCEGKPGGMLYFKVDNPIISGSGPASPEKIEREIIKKLKMNGLVLADSDVVNLMDGQISGYSDIIPVALKKDGGFYSSSSIATEEQFTALRQHLKQVIKGVGQGILAGNVKIEPYLKGHLKPCNYCKYKAVCQFDVLLSENTYRVLKKINRELIWDLLDGQRGEEEHG